MEPTVGSALRGDFTPFEEVLNGIEDCVFSIDDLSPSQAIAEFQSFQQSVQQVLSRCDYASIQQKSTLRELDDLTNQGLATLKLMKDMNHDFGAVLKKMVRVREKYSC